MLINGGYALEIIFDFIFHIFLGYTGAVILRQFSKNKKSIKEYFNENMSKSIAVGFIFYVLIVVLLSAVYSAIS